MSRAANPENVRKIAQVDQLIRDYRMSIPQACERAGLNVSTYHSTLAKRRERADEAQSWAYVGKSKVENSPFNDTRKEST